MLSPLVTMLSSPDHTVVVGAVEGCNEVIKKKFGEKLLECGLLPTLVALVLELRVNDRFVLLLLPLLLLLLAFLVVVIVVVVFVLLLEMVK